MSNLDIKTGLTIDTINQTGRNVVVEAKDLRKNYKNFQAVKGISFQVYQKECFGLLGPNGAGKSTTIRMLNCVSPISGGSLTVLGHSVTGDIRQIKAQIGVVPQDDNLDVDLTVMQNLLVYARYFNIDKKEATRRADEVLELFQLTEKRNNKTDEISGGMKRRLVIARALINQPKLIILDEPTTGLDPAARQVVWQQLRLLRERGVTILLTTHYMDEATQLCDRLVIINEGRIMAEGNPRELVQRLVGYEVIEMRLAEKDKLNLLPLIENRPILLEEAGDTLYLFGQHNQAFQNLTLPEANYRLRREASLEDVFLRLTGRGLGGE
ncbi:MAG: ABC transporter ATP-binding protein [Chloroflexi bacterium]|nr:ABC transporter ATP-binding protein [Chloroflexota bacterium]